MAPNLGESPVRSSEQACPGPYCSTDTSGHPAQLGNTHGRRWRNKHFQDLRKRVTVEDGDEATAGAFPTSETGIVPNIIKFSVVLVFYRCRNKLAQNVAAQAPTY